MKTIRETLRNAIIILAIVGISITMSIMVATILVGVSASTELVGLITSSQYCSVYSILAILVVSFIITIFQRDQIN